MLSAPGWVKSRALGVYMLILHGGLALGSAGWGELANRTSLRLALLISAAGLALGIVGTGRYSLNHFEQANLDPSMHWPIQPLCMRSIMSMARSSSPSSIRLIQRSQMNLRRRREGSAPNACATGLATGTCSWTFSSPSV